MIFRKLSTLLFTALLALAVMHGQGCSSETKVDDATITQNIQTKIAGDATVAALNIMVETRDGVVSLTGTVDDKSQETTLITLAQSVEGVKSVDSKITVKPIQVVQPVTQAPVVQPQPQIQPQMQQPMPMDQQPAPATTQPMSSPTIMQPAAPAPTNNLNPPATTPGQGTQQTQIIQPAPAPVPAQNPPAQAPQAPAQQD